METFRNLTVSIREWIPLIFYVTSLIVIPIIYFEWRKLRRSCDKPVTPAEQDAN